MIPHSKPWLDHREAAAINAVVRSGMLANGAEAHKFATALGANLGEAHLFASGRQALSAALQALKLPVGTSVAVQTYVCDAVIWAIRQAGLSPALCDVGPHWTCTPETVAPVIARNCGAILLAPPFGFLQSAAPYRRFALPIVHDLCQAAPSSIHSAPRNDLGDVLTLSFHPTKYLCAAGGGAAIAIAPEYRAELRRLQNAVAESAPFSDIQAAIGNVQLAKIPEIHQRRVELFELLTKGLSTSSQALLRESTDIPVGCLFRLPIEVASGEASSFFPLFAAQGVIVRHGVDQLAHRLAEQPDTEFPNAVQRIRRTLSLPFYPALEKRDALRIAKAAASIL
jgi:dTDP-4-amino-4,6-dideoxygalactose transaminase